MAQRKPEDKASLAQVLKLVKSLSPNEQIELWRTLDTQTWGERWEKLVQQINERRKDSPKLSEEEIIAEMKTIRKEVWTERAQSGS